MKILLILLITVILCFCNIGATQRSVNELKNMETCRTEAAPATMTDMDLTGDTKLYYNPEGGEKYHLNPNCDAVNRKFRPMQAEFTYAELNNPEYSHLDACIICGAPER